MDFYVCILQKLAELLYEAAELDELLNVRFIEEVLGVSKANLTAENREQAEPGNTPDETDSTLQQVCECIVKFSRKRPV